MEKRKPPIEQNNANVKGHKRYSKHNYEQHDGGLNKLTVP